jgi:hypothetical protein
MTRLGGLHDLDPQAVPLPAGTEAARQASSLPRHPDVARAERVLRAARAEAARRFVEQAPGPWGADAPSPPEAHHDD